MLTPKPLRLLVYPEAGFHVAQCLEYDIAVQGKELSQALNRFVIALLGHVLSDIAAGREPLSNLPKAPEGMVTRYLRAQWVVPQSRPKVDLPDDLANKVPPAWLLAAMDPELRVA